MPTLILFNGKLHTQDDRYTDATAIALRGDEVLAVGRDEEILVLSHRETETIDLQGRRVLPGLVDAHIHFYEWATLLRMIELGDVMSLAELQAHVRDAVANAEDGAWIIGQGWNQDSWEKPILPTKEILDVVAPNNPVI